MIRKFIHLIHPFTGQIPYQFLSPKMVITQLLVSFHGGYLWLDKPISVDVELITVIIGLPLPGIDRASYLRKYQDTVMMIKMIDKYDLVRDNKGFAH